MESQDEFRRRIRHEREVDADRKISERHHRENLRALKAASRSSSSSPSSDGEGSNWLRNLVILVLVGFALVYMVGRRSGPSDNQDTVVAADFTTDKSEVDDAALPADNEVVEAAAALPANPPTKVYPPCSATVTDNCLQK
jgi:hypothetical protein